MSELLINYDLGRNGWSSFALELDGASLTVGPFGYCTDALGDLVRTALTLAAGADRAEARFDGEPQEWRLIVDEGSKVDARLSVRSFNDIWTYQPEGEGVLLFEGRVRVDSFARAVRNAAQGLWETFGAAGYNERWTGDRGFPLRALLALNAALSHGDAIPEKQTRR